MKIANGTKQDLNNKNTCKMIFKQIKEEIKNVVINKYINQIERLSKTIEKLKKENSLLKNDLIYILKRVLLNKNDYTNVKNNKNLTIYGNTQPLTRKSLTNTSSLLNSNKCYNSFLSSGESMNNENNYYNNNYNYGNINNSTINNPKEQRRYSIDDDNKKGNISITPIESSRQASVQNKINYYLNSLYKHNFAEECAAGTASIHLLNKNQSIYDELFMNKINRNNNKSISRLNTDRPYKKISKSKGKSSSNSKTKIILVDSRNKQSLINNYKAQKNKTNGYLKVKKKSDIFNNKVHGINIRKDKQKNKKGNKSTINISTNSHISFFYNISI